jgi:hypothetical protein
MKIKSFGCSFVFGNELSDDQTNGQIPSLLTWPALMSKHYAYNYQCHAVPGSGNLNILNHVLAESTESEPAVFLIGWTWAARFDYIDISQDKETWKTLVPAAKDKYSEYYYKMFNSQTQDKLLTLIYIKTALDVLKQKNIPFIMTAMESMIFETHWHNTPAIQALQKTVLPCLTTFDSMNFLDWSREKKFPISDTWHPLDQAHRTAADYMITVFDKRKTSGSTHLNHV